MADQAVIDSINAGTLALCGTPPDLTRISFKARDVIRKANMSLHPDDVSNYLVTDNAAIIEEAVDRVEQDIA